jgi:PKD repeat protein
MKPQMRRMVLEQNAPVQFTYQVLVTNGQATTPKFTFGAGAPATTVYFGDGTAPEAVTSGVEMSHAYAVGGTYTVGLAMTNQEIWLTQIDLSSDYVVVPAVWNILLRLRALTRLIDLWAVGFGEVGIMKVAR